VARAAIDAGKFESAKMTCQNALVLEPGNVSLLLLHGKACTALGEVWCVYVCCAARRSVQPALVYRSSGLCVANAV
jgi:hypothetical protein